jgi:D-glycero-alpha-D-manno-heptose 1-phosphate guanylyltransferase
MGGADPMQAIVLAGGLGTRLRAAIGDVPKPMAPVNGVPFLEYLLSALARQGVHRVVLSVGYLHEVIERHFGSRFGAMAVDYAIENEPLGTGGAIRCALRVADKGPCFVLNGDTFVGIDLVAMKAAHTGALTIGVFDVDDVGRYGALAIDDGVVRGFVEKGAKGPGAINAGVYLLGDDLFDRWPLPARFSFENDFLMPHVGELAPRVFRATGPFLDIGVPDDYRAAASFFERLGENPAASGRFGG